MRVIGIPEGREVSKARFAYHECARQVLRYGLRLLEITPVERQAELDLVDWYKKLMCMSYRM